MEANLRTRRRIATNPCPSIVNHRVARTSPSAYNDDQFARPAKKQGLPGATVCQANKQAPERSTGQRCNSRPPEKGIRGGEAMKITNEVLEGYLN
jgi:hypothetical protein